MERKEAGTHKRRTTGTNDWRCIQGQLKLIAEDPREVAYKEFVYGPGKENISAQGRADDSTMCYEVSANIIDNFTPVRA